MLSVSPDQENFIQYSFRDSKCMNFVSSATDNTDLGMNVFLFSPVFKCMCFVAVAGVVHLAGVSSPETERLQV